MPKSEISHGQTPASWALKGALGVGVLSVSSAAILIKLAPAPASAIAFWRLVLTIGILAPWAIKHRVSWKTVGREAKWLILSGIFLALHFLFWIRSLSLTTVAVSTALVSIHPVLVALWSRLVGHRAIRRQVYVGGILVLLGLIVVTLASGLGWQHLWGVFDAFLGAVFAAGYLLVGQHSRQRLRTTHYAVGVYAVAALLLGSVQWARYHQLGPFTPTIWLLYAAMAIFPTLGGHTLFNWLLRYVPATEISLAFLGEIAGASILARIVLGQVPTPTSLTGVVLILGGLVVTQWPATSALLSRGSHRGAGP